MTNNPKNTKKAPQMALSYKCTECKTKVENGIPKYKGTKLLCERCFYLKRKGKSTRPKFAIQQHYLKWAGIIR